MVNTFYYAGVSCYSLPKSMSIKEAKVWVRNFYSVKRLPNGTCFSYVDWSNFPK